MLPSHQVYFRLAKDSFETVDDRFDIFAFVERRYDDRELKGVRTVSGSDRYCFPANVGVHDTLLPLPPGLPSPPRGWGPRTNHQNLLYSNGPPFCKVTNGELSTSLLRRCLTSAGRPGDD
jgi:hypothetical protein